MPLAGMWDPVAATSAGAFGQFDVTLYPQGWSADEYAPWPALSGVLTSTLGAVTLSATGQVQVTGTLAVTLGAVTLAATGTVADPPTGGRSSMLHLLTRPDRARHAPRRRT